MCDAFSKWMETCALGSIEAAKVSDALIQHVILRHGIPDNLHSDQGRNFESQLFQRLCERLGIEKTRTSPFHPSGNAIVERGNRTLGNMLATVIAEDQKDWDEQLPFVTWAYNTSVHSTTKMSPYQVLHGWPPRLPLDILLPSSESGADVCDFVEKTRERLLQAHQLVHRKLRASQTDRNRRYNRDVRFKAYAPGSLVMLNTKVVKPGRSKCLSDRWTGPYRVVDRVGKVNYRIRPASGTGRSGRRCTIVHHDRLKIFVSRKNSLQPALEDPSVSEDEGTSGCWLIEEEEAAVPELEDRSSEASREAAEEPGSVELRRSSRVRRPPDFYQAGF